MNAPTSCTREFFLDAVRRTNTLPILYSKYEDLLDTKGLRATPTSGLPIGQTAAFVWADGLCLVSEELFKELESMR